MSKNYIRESKKSLKSLVDITALDIVSAEFKYIDPDGDEGVFTNALLATTNDYVYYNITDTDVLKEGTWSIWCIYTDSSGDTIRGDTTKIIFQDNSK